MPPLTSWQRWARRRSRAHGVPHSDVTRADVLARTGGRCYLCGTTVTADDFEVDHVIPVSRGGPHVLANLAPACGPCNARKAARVVALPASELARAVVWTGAIVRRLAQCGITSAPVYPAPGAFGPHVVTLRVQPAPGMVAAAMRAAPEIEAALGELRAGTPTVRYAPPHIVVEVPRVNRRPVALADMRARGLAVQVGVAADSRPAVIDLAAAPHVLIGGATGGGKSVLLQTLAHGLACGGATLALADGDASTFDAMRDWHALAYQIADTAPAAVALACEVQSLIDRRKAAQAGAHAPIVLMIDEAQLVTADKRGRMAIADIAARGRKHGVHLVLATQYVRADVLDTRITGQCGWRVAMRLETEVAARLIGCAGASRLAGRGDCLIAHAGRTVRAQIALGTADDMTRVAASGIGQNVMHRASCAPIAAHGAGLAEELLAWAVAQGPHVSGRAIRLESQRRAPDGRGIGTEAACAIRDMARAVVPA